MFQYFVILEKKVIMRKVIFLLCCFFCVTATAQTFEISISGKEKWEIKVSLGNVLRYYMYEEDIPSSIPGLYDKIEWSEGLLLKMYGECFLNGERTMTITTAKGKNVVDPKRVLLEFTIYTPQVYYMYKGEEIKVGMDKDKFQKLTGIAPKESLFGGSFCDFGWMYVSFDDDDKIDYIEVPNLY